ncbi:hypothetical protein ACFWQG_13010 [Rhodococcus sp. NPDC058532]|uniref:hypothetical protein n=1 Tax=Rhodococcus sp. NPDC058532 TaxID=3346540 RepID=UPI00364B08A5
MTVPGGDYPDGTFGDDLSGLDGLNEAAWRQQKLGTLQGFDDSHAGFKPTIDNAAKVPSLVDGQTALEHRADLLEGVVGYCSLVQSKNWSIPGGGSPKKLPFDFQVGPAVGASPSNGGIRMHEKGLWRIDTLITFDRAPNFTVNTVAIIGVVADNSGGAVYSQKHFYRTVSGSIDPQAVFFSHTLVIPDDNKYTAYIYVGQTGAGAGYKAFGGTMYSALSVNKWDNRTINSNAPGTVPDGGSLS